MAGRTEGDLEMGGGLGDIAPSAGLSASEEQERLNTLDEPISATVMRDVRRVATKLKHVLNPRSESVRELRDWDLWGPLVLCLTLAVSLSWSAADDQATLIFSAVFVIVWLGSGFVTANAALLGGQISLPQSVCVLGYCVGPLTIASILAHLYSAKLYKLCVVAIACVWSTRASVGFMAQLVEPDRRALGLYPVVLFYLVISWMVIDFTS